LQDPLKTGHLYADLKGRSVRGGLVTIASQGTQVLVQTVSTVVLARLLSPADNGIVAMVAVVTGLAMGFADLGLSEATIQRKEITHEQVSALFWINLSIGLGLMLITAALAPALVWFYREPRLFAITLVSSVTFLFGGLRVQAEALLKRQMRYSHLGIRDVVSNVLAVSVAIAIALRGGGYWAIVALPLVANFSQMSLSWIMVKWRPSMPRRHSNVGSMVHFGGRVAASYFLYNLDRSADNALIGSYWGAAPLGLYSRAYNLLLLPVRLITSPISGVAIPAFSRVQHDPERFSRYYLATIGLVIWTTTPLFGFLFVAAEPVIVLLLGRQWREAASVFQFLSISAPCQLLLESAGWILISSGQSGRLLKLYVYMTPAVIGSFVIGLHFGIKGVALSYSIVLILILPLILKFTFRTTLLTLKSLGRRLVYPFSVGLSGVCVAELGIHIINPVSVISQLMISGLGFVATYSIAVFFHPVRNEILSFKRLFSELRNSSRAAGVCDVVPESVYIEKSGVRLR
jgi:PST family polysaccharide transporter